MWSGSANWNVATYMWFMCAVTCWLYKCWGVNIWIKLVVYFINKCYIVFPVGVCILPDGLAGRGELEIPVGLFFLSAIPDGGSGKIKGGRVKPRPDRNYRQGLFPVGHPTGNSTLSWRAVPVGWFPTVGRRERHSWRFFGYSWWFLADRNFSVSSSAII